MVDNVLITPGSGDTVAADEVTDGTLGTVKVQYIKLMDGTLDSTNKGRIDSSGNLAQNLAAVGGTTFSLGQKVSATSISVVVASDQTAVSFTPKTSQTGTVSLVAATTSDAVLLAANTARLGFSIYQTATSNLNLLLATGVSSTTNFSVVLFQSAYFEGTANYVGVVKGNWTAASSGTAFVTEYT